MKKSFAIIAATAFAIAAISAPAVAGPPSDIGPSSKGTTFVVPSDLTGSVLKGVLKPGSLTGKGAGFGIVGNPAKGPIKHVGGLAVDGSAGILKDSFLELRNFWIFAGDGVVTGQVEGFGRAPLFTFDPADAADLKVTLKFTETASLAVIGTTAIAGAVAGEATIELR